VLIGILHPLKNAAGTEGIDHRVHGGTDAVGVVFSALAAAKQVVPEHFALRHDSAPIFARDFPSWKVGRSQVTADGLQGSLPRVCPHYLR